ncbi:MAG: relaxase/mobilization nuclease domain-containing protein [Cyclobacteriaceae bacterium]
MIINGQAVKGATRLANHLMKQENEHVEVLEVLGTANENLYEALRDMEAVGAMTQSQTGKVLYHANIDPRQKETLTKEQYIKASDTLMNELGFTGQPRAIVMHVKGGRQHAHLVVQLTDTEKGKLKQVSNNYYKHKDVAKQLEREFQLEKAPRDKTGKSYNQKEAQQAKRLDKTVRQQRLIVRDCFDRAKDGKDFDFNLRKKEMMLAKGKRIVVLDKHGNAQSLNRQLNPYIKSKQVKEKIKDIVQDLPDIDTAQQYIRQEKTRKELEKSQQSMEANRKAFSQFKDMEERQRQFNERLQFYKDKFRQERERELRP